MAYPANAEIMDGPDKPAMTSFNWIRMLIEVLTLGFPEYPDLADAAELDGVLMLDEARRGRKRLGVGEGSR